MFCIVILFIYLFILKNLIKLRCPSICFIFVRDYWETELNSYYESTSVNPLKWTEYETLALLLIFIEIQTRDLYLIKY